MRFLRRIAGIFGFGKDEPHEENEDDHHRSQQHNNHHNRGVDKGETRRPTQGFSVQVPIPVDRAPLGPVIAPSNFGDGGVQVHLQQHPSV
ncbi:hypothetical protein GIB67_032467 [Kingdonia uniflora]|uniref:Uncharacterized protein n=1 Tax=Kingdonia uniflora TaxID=39325 RepID=A0A7J7L7K6_9MAGN|nr:hypothetical protein GIB67_032467 [Kingdonia uniflora]